MKAVFKAVIIKAVKFLIFQHVNTLH